MSKIADPQVRKSLGVLLPSEVKAKNDRKLERELHDQVLALLRLRGVRFVCHARMDRRTTTRVGQPDALFVYHDKACAIELKRPGETPRPEQVQCMADMEADGWRTLVATTLEEVKEWLDAIGSPR